MSAPHNRSPALGGLGSQLADWIAGERGAVGEDVLPRFPLARRGYDCAAVDEHVAELEQELAALDAELAELRGQKDAQEDVASQIKQIGEQTSAVLVAAHEQREQMLRSARAEAERCVAEAATKARAAAADGEGRLRELEAQTETAQRQRDRLLEEVRTVSAALAALADSSQHQVAPAPAQPEAQAPIQR